MIKLLVLYLHLIATCTAIGSILATDLRVVSRLRTPGFRLSPPNRFVVQVVSWSLALLWLTGAGLVAIGVNERPDFLQNPKLQGKLLLVAALTLNAAALHLYAFPRLQQGRRIDWTAPRDSVGVGMPVAASNALWLYCAFLGVARPWNHVVPLTQVLGLAVLLTALAWTVVVLAMIYSSTTKVAAPSKRAVRSRRVETAPCATSARAATSLPLAAVLADQVKQRRLAPAAKVQPAPVHR